MLNFAIINNVHNKKILNENIAKTSCNCRVKASCLLGSNCLQSSLVYIFKTATPNINRFKLKIHLDIKAKKTQLNYRILYGRINT